MPDTTTRRGWRGAMAAPRARPWDRLTTSSSALPITRLMLVAGVILATALVYAPSSRALGAVWSGTGSDSYSHGFLLLLTSLWLLARERERLAAVEIKPQPLALPVLLLASAVWLIFWRAAIQDLHLLLLPILALVAILAAYGWPTTRIAAFPLLFVDFAMPIWGNIRVPLQHLSSLAVGGLIWLTGLPAIMAGNIIHLPAGSLEIAEGCSGVNFLMVGLAMATLYGEVSRDPLRRRFVWIGLMGVLALIANWVRIYLIAVIAYRSQMRSSLVADHYWFGWVLFAVFFAGFLWIVGRIAPPVRDRTEVPGPAGNADASSNGRTLVATDVLRSGVSLGSLATALVVLAVLPVLVYGQDSLRTLTRPDVEIQWPAPSGGWHAVQSDSIRSDSGPEVLSSGWSPQFPGATATSRRRLIDADGEPIELFVAAYRTQSQTAKLVGYEESLLGPREHADGQIPQTADGGRLLLETEHIVTSPAGPWREMTVRDAAGAESLIWLRYQIGNRPFIRPRLSQLWYGVAALVGVPVSSITALRTGCTPNCDVARERLAAALHLLPIIRPAAVPAKEEE